MSDRIKYIRNSNELQRVIQIINFNKFAMLWASKFFDRFCFTIANFEGSIMKKIRILENCLFTGLWLEFPMAQQKLARGFR